jgi:hypothetical protein
MSEIEFQSKLDSPSNSAKSSPKYTINVIFTGPQVVDKKSTFYVKDDDKLRKKRSNSNIDRKPVVLKDFTEQEAEYDRFITTKIKQKENIEEIFDDEILKKFFKK